LIVNFIISCDISLIKDIVNNFLKLKKLYIYQFEFGHNEYINNNFQLLNKLNNLSLLSIYNSNSNDNNTDTSINSFLITWQKLELKGGLKKLKYLDLSKQNISIDLFNCILRSCPSLQILLVYNCRFYIDTPINAINTPINTVCDNDSNYIKQYTLSQSNGNTCSVFPFRVSDTDRSKIRIITNREQITSEIINIFGDHINR
jgi:hypothetical protein